MELHRNLSSSYILGNNASTQLRVALVKLPSTVVQSWFAVYMSVCISGGLGNLVLLLSTRQNRRLRHGAGALISIVLALFAFEGIIAFPAYGIVQYGDQVLQLNLSPNYCKFAMAAFVGPTGVCMWIEAFLAVNRVNAVLFPHTYEKWRQLSVMIFAITSAWVLGGAPSVPPVFGYGGGYIKNSVGGCAYPASGPVANTLISIAMWFPMALSASCYVVLAVSLSISRRKSAKVQTVDHIPRTKALERRVAFAKMAVVMFVLNAMTYLVMPIYVVSSTVQYLKYPLLAMWMRIIYPAGFCLIPVRNLPLCHPAAIQKRSLF